MEKLLSPRGVVFLVLFAVLAYIALQINTFEMHGAKGKYFTSLDFFGPVAGSFLGLYGVAVVGAARLINAICANAPLGLVDILKLTPIMFGAYYFWRNGARGLQDRFGLLVPIAAMAAFWLNPIGQQAWFYALYWLIPIIAKFLPDRLFLRSLGATFTQHAVGSVLFLYTIPMAPEYWIALLPFVAIDRTLLALGISVSHVLFTNVLNAVDNVWSIKEYVNVEKRYVLSI